LSDFGKNNYCKKLTHEIYQQGESEVLFYQK
jgi:hypothetical protein